ncbi:MAG: hypothetical protein GX996_02790 [Firmicutes bacterium]|nr:hypothetical protein [Bacillota bacterium]
MSIQNDIDAALPGGVVNIVPGTYNEQLIIDKPLTLSGPVPSAGEAIVDAAGLLAGEPTIHILSSDVIVENLTVQNGPGEGIRAGSIAFPGLTNITIRNNIIKDHDNAGILTVNDASMLIEDNTVVDNGKAVGFQRVGVFLYPHGETQVLRNIIKNNYGDGIFARESSSGLLIEENIIENHNFSGITLAWDEINVTIRNNEISACGQGINDEQGGIVIIQSMAEIITGNTIQNCNPFGIHWGWTPSFGPAPAQILISGNTIVNSVLDGIFLFSQGPGGFISPDPFPLEPDILGNQLMNNGRVGINVSNFYYYSPGNANPKIHFNSITGNVEFGVFNGTTEEVDATNNWWGSSSGPFHPALNPQGTGDPVSNNVLFSPWKTVPPLQEMDCLVMEKIFDQCFQENIIVRSFAIPVSSAGSCGNIDLTRVDRVECAIIAAKCKVADVGPPANNNLRIVTVRYELDMQISLIAERVGPPEVLCSFETTVEDFYSQVQLYIPPPGVHFGPAGGPFLFCEIVSSSCFCSPETLLPGEPITNVFCTAKICTIVEATAFVKVLVPHLGICTFGPCETVPQQKEIACPPIGELFPPQNDPNDP